MYLGETSLIMASKNGYLDVARILVENGALVDAKDGNGNCILILVFLLFLALGLG